MGRVICPPATRADPRWLLMLAAAFIMAALAGLIWRDERPFTPEQSQFVTKLAGKVAAGFGLVYLAAGLWAASVQPAVVKSMLVTPPAGYEFYKFFGFAVTAGSRWLPSPCWLPAIAGFGKFSTGLLGVFSWTAVLLACSSRLPSRSIATASAT